MARLDRLAAVKEIAQIGAAIGARRAPTRCCTRSSVVTSRR